MTASSRPAVPAKRSFGRTFGRIVWMSVKLLIIPVLCILALILGLAVGYAVLGGRPVSEVFDWNTWKHMYDLVFGNG
jgi:hypothetical protein